MPSDKHLWAVLAWGLVLACGSRVDAQFDFIPSIQVTGSGSVPTESDYIPNVVFCENGLASFEALKAQAVAARTFAYYKMNLQGFINDGTGDQVYSCGGEPSTIHHAAAQATEGEILYIRDNLGVQRDVLIASFYVAGAIPTGPFNAAAPSAVPNPTDRDPTNTNRWVTYTYENGDYAGNNVGSPLGFQGTPSNPNWPNRGAKSQNGADFLSDNSVHYIDILKYYYGADIQLRTASTRDSSYEYREKTLTSFDNYGERFGPVVEGHAGYFHRPLTFSGSTTANVADSTATRTSSEQQSGTDSQLIRIHYDDASDNDFLVRHVAGALLSDFGGNSNAADRVANLQFESEGSVGFWLKTDDAGVSATLAVDDPTTGDRGRFQPVIADNKWHRYEWFLDKASDWEPWPGVGGNGRIDGSLITVDSIQFTGATDAEIYLDTVFWDPAAVPTTGDFDSNGAYTCADVDRLVAEIVSQNNGAEFDLTANGLVNEEDLNAWLTEAGAAERTEGNAYLRGDANLDGVVNDGDLAIWTENAFTVAAAWCSGDFNADGSVDVRDFNIWNDQREATGELATVPEPRASHLFVAAMLCLFVRQGQQIHIRPGD